MDDLFSFRNKWIQELATKQSQTLNGLHANSSNQLHAKQSTIKGVTHQSPSNECICIKRDISQDDCFISTVEDDCDSRHSSRLSGERSSSTRTCDQVPYLTGERTNLNAFQIAHRLLHGEVLTESDVFRCKMKRLPSGSIAHEKFHSLKRYKHSLKSRITNTVFNQESICAKTLVDTLITDLNEITDIPFFDLQLPREVALQIFQHLDIVDLCHCAQVNKSWRRLSEDELLWSSHCHSHGYEIGFTTLEKKNWKGILKDAFLRERMLRQNWKNRRGKLYEMEDASAGVISAAHSCDGYIIAGFSSGKINLWNVRSDAKQLQNTLCPFEQMPDMNPDLSTAVTCISVNPDVIAVGYEQGQICILKTKLEAQTPYFNTISSGQVTAIETSSTGDICIASSENIVTVFNPNLESPVNLRHSSKVSHISLLPHVSSERIELTAASADGIYYYLFHPQEESKVVHHLIGSNVTAMDTTKDMLVAGITSRTDFNVFQVPVFTLDNGRLLGTFLGHSGAILCLDIQRSPPNLVVTGSRDKQVRVFDLRTFHAEVNISAHTFGVTQAQMNEYHIVTGGEDGLTCVWDLRSQAKLWEMYSRHSVKYLKFDATTLVTANIPDHKHSYSEDGDIIVHKRQRGNLRMYDFSVDQESKGIPAVCLSSYDEPAGYNYNIKLSVPYDCII